jgi:mitochondrial fission protein ELM1
VWLLSDGQPGHDSRSQGIVRALGEVVPVDVHTVRVGMRMGLARNALRFLLNKTGRPRSLNTLRLFYRMDHLPQAGCDLIVSAGGKTSFANAWIAAATGAPNIFAGTLRRLQARHFSVVMTLEPVAGADNNLVVPLLPTTIDLQRVAGQGELLRQQLGDAAQRYWLLLLGGKGAGYWYRQRDWMRIARIMNALANRYGIRWLLVTSRRTGAAGERMLKRYVNADCLAQACWSEDGDAFQAEAFLGAADQVFVSEDSMTMLTEAMSAQRPVYSLRPEHALPDNRYEQALLRYVDDGRLCRFALAELVERPERFDERRYVPGPLPASHLGQTLLQRLAAHPP